MILAVTDSGLGKTPELTDFKTQIQTFNMTFRKNYLEYKIIIQAFSREYM